MNVLFLSFYYTPDLCAGSFRAAALIQALKSRLSAGSHIDVLTTLPNRYKSYSASAETIENDEAVTVHRIALPTHQSGMRDQSKAFLAYARGVRRHVLGQQYDLVFATSSRLMTAVLGATIARRIRAPLYLDVRDIFVDTIQDILPYRLGKPIGALFSYMERYAIGSASKVNLVSHGFASYFSQRYPAQRFVFYPNGIDDEFIPSDSNSEAGHAAAPASACSILYAGNLGEGQGLHVILPGLAAAMAGRAEFVIIGDGGRKKQLIEALDVAGVDNVKLLDPVNRDALVQAYQRADVLFPHLNDHAAFRKVLPSKLFEYAAVGKPVWAGVAGYAAEFISSEIENSAVFSPCNVASAVKAFSSLKLQSTPRSDFIQKYARRNIMQSLADDILATAEMVRK